MTRLGRVARSAALVLGTGYVLCFFSETVFWSMWRPDEDPPGRVAQWFLYSLLGYLTLAVIRWFRVRDIWSLVLAGAFYGWVGEGVFAMTVFGDPSMPFPVTIAWTALAWHGPLAVVVGWYALGRALRDPGVGPILVLSVCLGLFWGVWALGWRAETPPVAAEPFEFLAHAFVTTAFLALAHRGIAAGRPEDYAPSRLGLILAVVAVLAFFGVFTVPTVPIAPLVLLPLLALLGLALRRGRAARADDSLLAAFAAPVLRRNLALLLLMPLVATVVYASALEALPPIASIHLLLAATTILGGTALFAVALAKTFRRLPT